MADFTVSVTSWRLGNGEVGTNVDPMDEQWILVEYPLSDNPDEKHVHAIPLSGIAFRMEMLGLSDPNEVVDIILKEMNTPQEVSQSVYPPIVETYYAASTNIAKALAEGDQSPMSTIGNSMSGMSPDDFLSNVRELLRGRSSTMTLRTSSVDSPLMTAISNLENSRTMAVEAIQTSQATVIVEETAALSDLKQTISGMADQVFAMADTHAHRAMETGAYYYASLLWREGS